MESRGRPSENVVKKTKYKLEFEDSIWYFDDKKSKNGAYKVEQIQPKGERTGKIKIQKGKAYGKMPVVMVFKTSNRSNAKTKIKVFRKNIDYILIGNLFINIICINVIRYIICVYMMMMMMMMIMMD